MSETIAPVKTFDPAESAVCHRPGPHTIALNEPIKKNSIVSLVYYYDDPTEAATQREAGVQKHYINEQGQSVRYTSVSTTLRPDLQPIGVHMAGYLPTSTLTYTDHAKCVAYLAQEWARAGHTRSVVADAPAIVNAPSDPGRINLGNSASRSSPRPSG